jgi:poly-gamma-glutamate capsule biosynthesis protein CapA/YwtB (metallophosphatase superfamily)
MTGRGLDQILPHPSRPKVYEPVVKSALEYVALAERAHGRIPRSVEYAYVWGAALEELKRRKLAARIINLETSITTSEDAAPKEINYRMHPANVAVLSAAGVDCAVLANNHVLDWGVAGLAETLDTLANSHIRVAGAGRTRAEAQAPAVINVSELGRVLVFAFGAVDSGVPRTWSASDADPGVSWIGDYTAHTAAHIAEVVASSKRPGDVVIASMHWGSNWGYDVPDNHRRFARELIDHSGVDLVYGHSSHHVKAIEIHRSRAILYGCGDFLNDYEGIHGPMDFRDDLTMMYFPTLDLSSGELIELEMVPLRIRNFRLQHPTAPDARWLCDTLDRECRRFGARVMPRDGRTMLHWG